MLSGFATVSLLVVLALGEPVRRQRVQQELTNDPGTPAKPSSSSITAKVELLETDFEEIRSNMVKLHSDLEGSANERVPVKEHSDYSKDVAEEENQKTSESDEEETSASLKESALEKSLRARVRKLEMKFPRMHDKMSELEEEINGEAKGLPAQHSHQLSLKGKLETMLTKTEGLKQRLKDLDPTTIHSDIAKFEDQSATHKAKLSTIANTVGVDAIEHTLTTSKSIKPRLMSLENYLTIAHGGTSSLEEELLGEASRSHVQSSLKEKTKADSHTSKQTTCVKSRLESIKSEFATLAERLTALEKVPTKGSLEKLEAKSAELQPKLEKLIAKVGRSFNADMETLTVKKESTYKARIVELLNHLTRLNAKLAPVEEELLGTGNKMPVSVDTAPTIKAKIDALEKVASSLETRLSSLQNEVSLSA